MDVVDHLCPRLSAGDISVVASASFPEVSHDPSSILGTAGRPLLDGLENLGHVIDFVHRTNEQVNMIGHEDIGKDNETVLLRGFVDAFGKEFTDLVVLEIGFAVIG